MSSDMASQGLCFDNIFDHRYFGHVLAKAQEAGLTGIVYEMKTNLNDTGRNVLDAVWGPRSWDRDFITPVLKLAGKGANALQNLQALKWFSEPEIEVKWNLLYGFPGEDPADYVALARLLPLLYHLHPPMVAGQVRMDRFAPYFANPAAHGMINPRPNKAFRYTFPFSHDVLTRLAYYYEYDYADGRDPAEYIEPVLDAVEKWHQVHGAVTLRAWDRPDGLLILHDTRPCATAFQHRMTWLDRELYRFCDTGRSLRKLLEYAADRAGDQTVEPKKIQRLLDQWVDDRLMVSLDGRYLSLALWGSEEGMDKMHPAQVPGLN